MKKFYPFLALFLSLSTPALAATGSAVIKGTKPDSPISGKADLTETPEGLKILVKLKNVPPGKHGFHIHEKGSCAEEGNAAGGHYNPEETPHGDLFKDGFQHAHAGDFGNLEPEADGTLSVVTVVKGLTLTGDKHNVANRAFILHEKEDTFAQPTGNAGGRIACGVIEIVEN